MDLVKRVLSVRAATTPRRGPGGVLYYLSDVTGHMLLWKFDGGKHDVVLPWDDRIGDYRVSKDGALAFVSDKDGDEKWRLYLADNEVYEISAEGVNNLGAW